MTVYISRHALADRSWRQKLIPEDPAWPQAPRADPPLLTHVWRQLFERQVQNGGRR
ncbi:multiple cyclophane-containing RiPP AmcA [Micromonospora sp. URMC 105]|uniref:multiple cyclophane-containing RiPP AmcA n=1 Tax=Micromonospora sp. URMC 105 TaxID=3423413 RepID=UPI003F19E5D7